MKNAIIVSSFGTAEPINNVLMGMPEADVRESSLSSWEGGLGGSGS